MTHTHPIVVFSEVLALLGDAAVPFAALAAVQRVIADELRHVRLCYVVVGWRSGRCSTPQYPPCLKT